VRLEQWVKGDQVSVSWDGQPLQNVQVRYCKVTDPKDISDVTPNVWLCFAMQTDQVSQGEHDVQVVLVERHAQLACELILTDVEFVVRYSD